MNSYKVMQDLLSLSEKGEKIMEIKDLYKKNTMESLKLNSILEKIDSQQLYVGEAFKVKGFLSKYAPVVEPKTYFIQSYKLGKIILKEEDGKVFRSAELNVRPCSLPVSKFTSEQEDKTIAFIYSYNGEERFSLQVIDDGINLKVKDDNKFIPIILSENLMYNLSNKEVEMIVKAKAINFKVAEEVYSYRTESFNEIKDYFYNIYNENVVSIILECVEVLDEKKVDVKDELYCFGVEYKVTSDTIKYEELCRKLNSTLNKFSVQWDCNSFGHEKTDIQSKLSHTDIQMNVCKEYVGFYMSIKINDNKDYKRSLEKLKSLVSRVKTRMGDNFIWKITFISDYMKEELFR